MQGSFLPNLVLGLHLHVANPVKQDTLLEEDQFACRLIVRNLGEVCHLVEGTFLDTEESSGGLNSISSVAERISMSFHSPIAIEKQAR